MKILLKLANGATLEFEGDGEEFERVAQFLSEPPDSLTAEPPAALRETAPYAHESLNGDGPPEPDLAPAPLEPATVAQRLEQVGASNDQERVTVIAQLAKEGGREGIDYATLNELYTELGFRKPAQFPSKTFANAKASGLVQPVKPGIWRPTYRGENFARGLGRRDRQARRSPSRPQGSLLDGGGESD